MQWQKSANWTAMDSSSRTFIKNKSPDYRMLWGLTCLSTTVKHSIFSQIIFWFISSHYCRFLTGQSFDICSWELSTCFQLKFLPRGSWCVPMAQFNPCAPLHNLWKPFQSSHHQWKSPVHHQWTGYFLSASVFTGCAHEQTNMAAGRKEEEILHRWAIIGNNTIITHFHEWKSTDQRRKLFNGNGKYLLFLFLFCTRLIERKHRTDAI